jgi:hypothetical protein
MQEQLQRWIQIDHIISQKQKELDQLRMEKNQMETNMYQHVLQQQWINKKIKTTSGKTFVFRERNSYQQISQTFLQEVLQKFFTKYPNKSSYTPEQMFQYILQQRTSKKYFEIEKK